MTSKQRSYQINLLRALHLSPRYKNLYADDPIAYRAFLDKHLGVTSSKELNIGTLKELVEYFELKRDHPPTNKASNQQVAFIHHLWSKHAVNRDESSLLNFIERTLNRRLKEVTELTPQDAKKVIAGIKALKPMPYANNPNYKGG